MEKPIQKAGPKKSWGVQWVRREVAKNIPMTGRVVAMPSETAVARSVQRKLFRSCPARQA